MQGSSLSRRVRVGGVEPEDAVLRAELFRTFASYGVIEEACFEEDRAFHSGAAVIQFQRISASEKLQNDVEETGRRWFLSFLPPSVHVGAELLVTSPKAIDTSYLRSLVGEGVKIEEKLLSFPGAKRIGSTTAEEGAVDYGSKNAGARDAFIKALSSVRAHAIGRFAVLMQFATVHDANEFLTTHQMPFLTSNEMYVVHVGPDAALQHALKHILLTRRSAKDVAKGSVLRGFVLPQHQSGNIGGSGSGGGGNRMITCEVDAGLIRKGRPVFLHTQTNFVKVSPWDIVEVRLTSADGEASENLEAELRGVVNAASGTTEAQKPTVLFQRLRQAGGPSSSSSSMSTSASSKKALAGKLYQALHARKTEPDNAGEQLHSFPQGLHAFSVVSVCIQRVGNDGLYARTILPPHATSSTPSREWPVFVPSIFVPCEGGMDWKDFAVPGERMSVTLLYATAVGGSEAALRLVASKREADMRRASAFFVSAATPGAKDGAGGGLNSTKTLSVGTSFSGIRAVWLPRTPSTDNPVYILLPSSSSPSVLFTITVLMHATDSPTDHQTPETMTMDAGLHPFVIASIVNSDRLGHYAVAVEEAVYRQMEAERRAAEVQKESEQDAMLQRIMTEVFSNGASVPAGDGDDSAQSRKRPRSSQKE
ncbi:hypothetical protein TcYC6_0046690 [Trypanosoma cruzi]|nr:hypothetical protein TcYC6_0046690 [Trypanosoma cruzi]